MLQHRELTRLPDFKLSQKHKKHGQRSSKLNLFLKCESKELSTLNLI